MYLYASPSFQPLQPTPNSNYFYLYSSFLFVVCVCVSVTAKTMKPSLYRGGFLVFLIFLLYSSKLSASPMTSKQGKEKVPLNQMPSEEYLVQMEGSEIIDLMGLEECENSMDEECFKRRIMTEAHLDYIYTQHHKP